MFISENISLTLERMRERAQVHDGSFFTNTASKLFFRFAIRHYKKTVNNDLKILRNMFHPYVKNVTKYDQ